jgi:hypothetical protein
VTWTAGSAPRLVAKQAGRKILEADGTVFPAPYDLVFGSSSDLGLIGLTLDGKLAFSSPWVQQGNIEAITRTKFELRVLHMSDCTMRLDLHGELRPGPMLCAFRPVAIGFGTGSELVVRTWLSGTYVVDSNTGSLVRSRRASAGFVLDPATVVALDSDPTLAARSEKLFPTGTLQLTPDHRHVFVISEIDALQGELVELATAKARKLPGLLYASADGSRYAVRVEKDGRRGVEVRATASDQVIAKLDVDGFFGGLSDDGTLFVTTVKVEDSETRSDLEVIEVASKKVIFKTECGLVFALSRDGKRLACETGGVTVFNVVDGAKVATIRDIVGVDTLSFSPDGRRLAIGNGQLFVAELR